MKRYIEEHWFCAIKPFINIQRRIEQYLIDHNDDIQQWVAFKRDPINNAQPGGIRPPPLRNFTVIPNCNFHLKHIKIDTSDCYWLPSKFKAIPKFFNEITQNVKNERVAQLLNTIFDIVTDAVLASAIYVRQKRSKFFCFIMIYIKYMTNWFHNIIGIDPDDKTWLAGVRREIKRYPGTEIIRRIIELSSKNFTVVLFI